MKQVTMVLSQTTRGRKEIFVRNGRYSGKQPLHDPPGIAFIYFVALLLSTIMDQLAPIDFRIGIVTLY